MHPLPMSPRRPTGKIVEIGGDVPVGMHMSLGRFAEAISTRIWESVGRANWRPFEDARAFTRGLDLKSQSEWFDYCKSGKKPPDIPSAPQYVYAEAGWARWSDWLGTSSRHWGAWWPFKKARAYVRSLGLNSNAEWRDYCKSGKKPADIPTNPMGIYAKTGWISWGDWFGTGRHRVTGWQPFNRARAFVRSLGFTGESEWRDYCKIRQEA
jgi:hypothetical protein